MAQLHTTRPKHSGRKRRRVGRGGKRGTYSGRGMKGQSSRSGAKARPPIRDLIKRLPKLRGDSVTRPPRKIPVTVTLGALGRLFKDESSVTPRSLVKAGVIPSVSTPVKIVLGGSVPKKLTIKGISVSRGVVKAVEAAGGEVE